MAWECLGTKDRNSLTDLIYKLMPKIGFDLASYDPEFPQILPEDTLESYLAKINKDLFEVLEDVQPQLGDTCVFAWQHQTSGTLLNNGRILASPVIHDELICPILKGSQCDLHGFRELSEILISGYALVCVVRPTGDIPFHNINTG